MTKLSDFQIVRQIGKGTYCSVNKVIHKASGAKYALKVVKFQQSTSEREKSNALAEVRYLASIHHPNIISYKAAFIDEPSSTLCLVMEYANGGDLSHKVKAMRSNDQFLEESVILKVVTQMCLGIRALHKLQIMHRDLKSANIFLTDDFIVKVGDLNVSKIAKDGLNYTQAGTPYYASPEVWRDKPYDFKSDVWSLGCISYEMIAMELPFQAKDMGALYKKVIKGEFKSIPEFYSEDLRLLIETMLKVRPKDRISIDEILENPIIKKCEKNLYPRGDSLAQDRLQQQGSPKSTMNKSSGHSEMLLKTIYSKKTLQEIQDQLPAPRLATFRESRGSLSTTAGGPLQTKNSSFSMPLKERVAKKVVGEDSKIDEKIIDSEKIPSNKQATSPTISEKGGEILIMSKRSSKDAKKYAISNLKVDVKIDQLNNQNRKIDELQHPKLRAKKTNQMAAAAIENHLSQRDQLIREQISENESPRDYKGEEKSLKNLKKAYRDSNRASSIQTSEQQSPVANSVSQRQNLKHFQKATSGESQQKRYGIGALQLKKVGKILNQANNNIGGRKQLLQYQSGIQSPQSTDNLQLKTGGSPKEIVEVLPTRPERRNRKSSNPKGQKVNSSLPQMPIRRQSPSDINHTHNSVDQMNIDAGYLASEDYEPAVVRKHSNMLAMNSHKQVRGEARKRSEVSQSSIVQKLSQNVALNSNDNDEDMDHQTAVANLEQASQNEQSRQQNYSAERRIQGGDDLQLRDKSSSPLAKVHTYQTRQERDQRAELVRLSQLTGLNMVNSSHQQIIQIPPSTTTNHKQSSINKKNRLQQNGGQGIQTTQAMQSQRVKKQIGRFSQNLSLLEINRDLTEEMGSYPSMPRVESVKAEIQASNAPMSLNQISPKSNNAAGKFTNQGLNLPQIRESSQNLHNMGGIQNVNGTQSVLNSRFATRIPNHRNSSLSQMKQHQIYQQHTQSQNVQEFNHQNMQYAQISEKLQRKQDQLIHRLNKKETQGSGVSGRKTQQYHHNNNQHLMQRQLQIENQEQNIDREPQKLSKEDFETAKQQPHNFQTIVEHSENSTFHNKSSRSKILDRDSKSQSRAENMALLGNVNVAANDSYNASQHFLVANTNANNSGSQKGSGRLSSQFAPTHQVSSSGNRTSLKYLTPLIQPPNQAAEDALLMVNNDASTLASQKQLILDSSQPNSMQNQNFKSIVEEQNQNQKQHSSHLQNNRHHHYAINAHPQPPSLQSLTHAQSNRNISPAMQHVQENRHQIGVQSMSQLSNINSQQLLPLSQQGANNGSFNVAGEEKGPGLQMMESNQSSNKRLRLGGGGRAPLIGGKQVTNGVANSPQGTTTNNTGGSINKFMKKSTRNLNIEANLGPKRQQNDIGNNYQKQQNSSVSGNYTTKQQLSSINSSNKAKDSSNQKRIRSLLRPAAINQSLQLSGKIQQNLPQNLSPKYLKSSNKYVHSTTTRSNLSNPSFQQSLNHVEAIKKEGRDRSIKNSLIFQQVQQQKFQHQHHLQQSSSLLRHQNLPRQLQNSQQNPHQLSHQYTTATRAGQGGQILQNSESNHGQLSPQSTYIHRQQRRIPVDTDQKVNNRQSMLTMTNTNTNTRGKNMSPKNASKYK